MNKIFFVLIVLQTFWILCNSQSFNVFKSYKDAKVRPKNYARKAQRSFPVEDYLDQTQLSMLRKRQSKLSSSSDTMTDQWSGFDVYKRMKKNHFPGKDTEVDTSRRLNTEQQIDGSDNWFNNKKSSFGKTSEFSHFHGGILITAGMFIAVGSLLLFVLAYIGASLYYSKSLDEIDSSRKVGTNSGAHESNVFLRDLSAKTSDHV